MKTLTVDDEQRIRIPDAKPKQVFACENHDDGSYTLIPVRAKSKEPFPKGSLLRFFTPEKDKQELALLKGCALGPE